MKYLIILTMIFLSGCATPNSGEKGSIERTESGWKFYSKSEQFSVSAEKEGEKVAYDSRQPSLFSDVAKLIAVKAITEN